MDGDFDSLMVSTSRIWLVIVSYSVSSFLLLTVLLSCKVENFTKKKMKRHRADEKLALDIHFWIRYVGLDSESKLRNISSLILQIKPRSFVCISHIVCVEIDPLGV